MPIVLVVDTEFADYKRGDVITDEGEQEKVLGTHSHCLRRSNHPDGQDS